MLTWCLQAASPRLAFPCAVVVGASSPAGSAVERHRCPARGGDPPGLTEPVGTPEHTGLLNL